MNGIGDTFGSIADASTDADGRIYILDAASNIVRVFAADGSSRPAIGVATKTWPGFTDPVRLAHADSTLYVLDREKGLVLFSTARGARSYLRTIPLGLRAQDFCRMGDRLYVYGWRDSMLVHEYTRTGRRLRAFGEEFGPRGHPIQRLLSFEGHVDCLEGLGVVAVTSRLLPEVRGYRVSDGRHLWSAEIPNFAGAKIVIDPSPRQRATWQMAMPEGGASENVSIRALTPDLIIVQSVKVAPVSLSETVSTSAHVATSGEAVWASETVPLLLPLRGGRAITAIDQPYPKIAFVGITATSPR